MNQPKKVNNTKYPYQSLRPLEVLDLHGKSKEKAILSMTIFLSDCVRRYHMQQSKNISGTICNGEVWVKIITGCGKHSKQGPVLRKAVQATLNKREMIHVMDKWKGSFMVRADSGNLLTTENNAIDTKLLIVTDLPRRMNNGADNFLRSNLTTSAESSRPQVVSEGPLPSEVLHEEQSLQRAKDLSLRSASNSIGNQDEKGLHKVIKASKLTYRLENEILRQEEHFLEEVLKVSAKKEESEQEEERMLFDKAISESLNEQRQWEKEESFLEEVIAASLLHSDNVNCTEDEEINMSMMTFNLQDYN